MSDKRRELMVFADQELEGGEGLDRACALQGDLEGSRDVLGMIPAHEDASHSTNPVDKVHGLPFTNPPTVGGRTTPSHTDTPSTSFAVTSPASTTQPSTLPHSDQEGEYSDDADSERSLTPTADIVDQEPKADQEIVTDDKPQAVIAIEERHKQNEDLAAIANYFHQFIEQLKQQKIFASGEVLVSDTVFQINYRPIPAIAMTGAAPSPHATKLTHALTFPYIDYTALPTGPVKSPFKTKGKGKKTDSRSEGDLKRKETTPSLPKPKTGRQVTSPLPADPSTPEPSRPQPKMSKLSQEAPIAVGSSPPRAVEGGNFSDLINRPFLFHRQGGGQVSIELKKFGVTSAIIMEALKKKGIDPTVFMQKPLSSQAWICLSLTPKGKVFKSTSFPPSDP